MNSTEDVLLADRGTSGSLHNNGGTLGNWDGLNWMVVTHVAQAPREDRLWRHALDQKQQFRRRRRPGLSGLLD